jgi:hypothetical protein
MESQRATEVAIAVHALNRMLELGRSKSIRIAGIGFAVCSMRALSVPSNKAPHHLSFVVGPTFHEKSQ